MTKHGPKNACQVAALLVIAVLSSGCGEILKQLYKPPPSSNAAQQEAKPPPPPPEDPLSDEALAGLSFKDTELYHLFSPYPYNSQIPFEKQFPRVALTVLDAPSLQTWPIYRYTTDACWRLRAKIWFPPSSEAPSRDNPSRGPEFKDVEPFYWCYPRDVEWGINPETLRPWLTMPLPNNTGNQRIESSHLPPLLPMPHNLRHQKFWEGSLFNPKSMNGLMLASVLYYMSYDWSEGDPRVWVIEFIQAR